MNKIEFQMDNGRTIVIEEGVKYNYLNPINDIIFKSILRNDKKHIIGVKIDDEELMELKENMQI